jgi:hypothetical protein
MKRVTLRLVGISLVLPAAGYELLRGQRGATGSSANSGAPPARPLPVIAAILEMKDFPSIGLGTAQAYNAVTVKVRVDGRRVPTA